MVKVRERPTRQVKDMGFLNDKDGVSLRDFEKLVSGGCFILGVVTVVGLAWAFQFVDATLCGFVLGLGGLFILRKLGKYTLEGKTASQTISEATEIITSNSTVSEEGNTDVTDNGTATNES